MECVFEGVADLSRDAMVSWREGKTKESSRETASDTLRRRGAREFEEDLPSKFFVAISLQMSRGSILPDMPGLSEMVSGELSALGRAIPVVMAQ